MSKLTTDVLEDAINAAEANDDEKPKSESKASKRRTVKPLNYQLVEVVDDGDSVVYVPLPLPEGTDTTGKTPILRAVTNAAAKGDEQYDDKMITVIAFPKPQKFKAEPITVKRKVTFNL